MQNRMDQMTTPEPAVAPGVPSREQLLHVLYEAAELEHNLMCTYLYAAFSLKNGEGEGLTAAEADAVARWRRAIIDVAIDEMGHLAAVWNITSALGGAPRFGRGNFPLDPGYLPAGVVVKLAPFNRRRCSISSISSARGLAANPTATASRSSARSRARSVGAAPDADGDRLRHRRRVLRATRREPAHASPNASARRRRSAAIPRCSCRRARSTSTGAKPVICLKTALAAFDAIVAQGEGAPQDYGRFALRRSSRDPRRSIGAARGAIPRSRRRSRPRTIRCCAGRRGPKAASGSRTSKRRRPSISPTPATG